MLASSAPGSSGFHLCMLVPSRHQVTKPPREYGSLRSQYEAVKNELALENFKLTADTRRMHCNRFVSLEICKLEYSFSVALLDL